VLHFFPWTDNEYDGLFYNTLQSPMEEDIMASGSAASTNSSSIATSSASQIPVTSISGSASVTAISSVQA